MRYRVRYNLPIKMTTKLEDTFRGKLVEQYQRLDELGLIALSSGNISCRMKDGFLISPSGVSAREICNENIVYITSENTWDNNQQPSSEWQRHAAVYKSHPQAQAIVHTHSNHCVGLACQNKALPGFHYLVGIFGGKEVPCVPYATFGTEELANHVVRGLQGHSACLLANHGMICRAKSLAHAVNSAHQIEILCHQYLLCCQFGKEPTLLNDNQWQEFHHQFEQLQYGQQFDE